jgi:hypothetical protein
MHVTLSLGLINPFVSYKEGGRFPVTYKTTEGFPTSMAVDYVRVWQLSEESVKGLRTDFSKEFYIALEKAKWVKNSWNRNQEKVESNFNGTDTNEDGIATGEERKIWFSKICDDLAISLD